MEAGSHNNGGSPGDCQLAGLKGPEIVLSPRDLLRHQLLRLKSAVLRRIRKPFDGLPDPALAADGRPAPGKPLRRGDVVEVLTYDEIRQTLDGNDCFDHLEFMYGMRRYCGTRQTVLKRLNMMFDERTRKMIKLRNTVILKDVICDGAGLFDREGCDRSCFYFWKDRWLRPISPGAQGNGRRSD